MEAFPRAWAWCRRSMRSRRSWGILGAGAFLLLLGGFLARQARLTNEAVARAEAAERAATRASARVEARDARASSYVLAAPRDEQIQRTATRRASTAARARQLYEELDALMTIKNQIDRNLAKTRRKTESDRAGVGARGGQGPIAPAPPPPIFPTTLPEPLAVPR